MVVLVPKPMLYNRQWKITSKMQQLFSRCNNWYKVFKSNMLFTCSRKIARNHLWFVWNMKMIFLNKQSMLVYLIFLGGRYEFSVCPPQKKRIEWVATLITQLGPTARTNKHFHGCRGLRCYSCYSAMETQIDYPLKNAWGLVLRLG